MMKALPVLVIGFGGKLYPSFALAVLLQYLDRDALVIKERYAGIPNISLKQLDIHVDHHGQYMLGPPKEREGYSFIGCGYS